MKKLTIFRTAEEQALEKALKSEGARKIYCRAKKVKADHGETSLIYSSHVPAAMQSARIVKLVMKNARLCMCPFLSHYYAGDTSKFIKTFKNDLMHHFYIDHVVLVTHESNIFDLTACGSGQDGVVTIEAESWDEIFDKKSKGRKVSILSQILDAMEEGNREKIYGPCTQKEAAEVEALRAFDWRYY
jgi:phosphohistidine phosphatase SixA